MKAYGIQVKVSSLCGWFWSGQLWIGADSSFPLFKLKRDAIIYIKLLKKLMRVKAKTRIVCLNLPSPEQI